MPVPQPTDPVPELYQLLGVAREASGADIAHAYRRKARDAHPDSRPRDADAPARFRALAEAYQVLSDPVRRAAYDRSLRPEKTPHHAPARSVPGPPLWAGPVRVDLPAREPATGAGRDGQFRRALIAALVARYLDESWYQPW
jgi:curved DNA-binding protein CbpA